MADVLPLVDRQIVCPRDHRERLRLHGGAPEAGLRAHRAIAFEGALLEFELHLKPHASACAAAPVTFGTHYFPAPANAAFIFARSSFFIVITVCITASAFFRLLCSNRSGVIAGTICQETPNLSLTHPQGCSSPPPALSLAQ